MSTPVRSGKAAMVARSASWNYASNLIKLATGIGTTMFYARRLAPEEFGLLAMAQVAIRLSEVLADFGLGNAVVQRKELTHDDVKTALALSLLSSAGLYAILSLITPWLAASMGEPRLTPVLRLLALTVLCAAASTVLRGLLRRQMRFQMLAVIETIAQVSSHLTVGIPLVLSGYGVWGMIWAGMASALTTLAALLVVSRKQLGFGFSGHSARGLSTYSSRITMIALIQVAGHISQPLLMAKALGAASAGLFSTSMRLVSLPIEGVTTALRTVLFPVFSSSRNIRDLRLSFLQSYFVVANVVIAWSCFVFAAAEPLILLLLGDRWLAAVPIVRILTFVCGFGYMGSMISTLIDSSLDLQPKLLVDLCYFVLLLVSIVLLYRHGVLAVMAAYAALEGVRWVLYSWITLASVAVTFPYWFRLHLRSWPLLAAFGVALLWRDGAHAGSLAGRVVSVSVTAVILAIGLSAIFALHLGRPGLQRLVCGVWRSPSSTGPLLLDSLRLSAQAEA